MGHWLMTVWKRLKSDPTQRCLSTKACPMQAMALHHGTRRCTLKWSAKRVLFKGEFAVFWAQKEVVEAPNWVHTTVKHDERCLFII